jgi:8-oxo-dGTP diphosphatase/2-hydroxy-dATP diphosphatase
MRVETVSIVYEHPGILLGMKKVRFGKGKYNGFGGGVKRGETLEQSAIRETWEETGEGITLINPRRIGKILFNFQTDEQNHLVYFFRASEYSGFPVETEEMRPEWFDINEIPYDKMWSDDKYWLPLFLKGKSFRGIFQFDSSSEIVDFKLDEVDRL